MARLASVAVSVNCHSGTPKRSARREATIFRIFCRKHGGDSFGQLIDDGLGGRWGRMAHHCASVTKTQVNMVDSIHTLEMRPSGTFHIDRPGTGPFCHPQHRNPTWHPKACFLEEFPWTGDAPIQIFPAPPTSKHVAGLFPMTLSLSFPTNKASRIKR